MNAITTTAPPLAYGDIERLADAIAKSNLFGIKTKDQALVLMMIARSEGRDPVEAARDYDIINGRPAKKAEAMMRDFVQAGGKVEWHSLTDELADATFTHPQTGSVRIDWDMKRATTAFGKKDMYAKFPRQMLRSRVVSEGVRTLWPLATSGMYVQEEVADIPHNGPTIEADAPPDAREAFNAETPMRAAAADMPRGATVREPSGNATTTRTDAQWRAWLDKLRAACEVLYRREELVELANRASIGDAIATGPEPVRAEISRILAENYARFPDEAPHIEGEERLAAG